ncbi:MAG: transketolase [Spirochaetes bacterium]|nr:MAG: transketolase [Spirochaetota bacterium]
MPKHRKESAPAHDWTVHAARAARGIRRRVLAHTVKNNGGYLSQACSSAELFATLYLRVLNLGPVAKPIVPPRFPGVPGPGNPDYRTGAAFHGARAPERDRFYLSPSQYSLVLYAALIEAGRMDECGLDEFNKDGGVVEMIGAEHSPGMEIMTGSLGQGLSQAAGIAMGRARAGETGRTVVFMSDGEFQIGQTWEAVQAMSFHGLGSMLVFADINGYQCDGKMDSVMNIEPLEGRLASFGARVLRIDGHDIEGIARASSLPPDGRPLFVLADTDPCRGIELLRSRYPKFHYLRFTGDDERERYAHALEELFGEGH